MKNYIGIDIGKDYLDIAFDEKGKLKAIQIDNDQVSILAYLDSAALLDAHFIFEATGPYHLTLAYLLKERCLAFTIVNPTASSAYAKSLMSTAKTDKQDAMILLKFGKERCPNATQLPDNEWQEMRQYISEWQHCKELLNQESNRLQALKAWSGSSAQSIKLTQDRIGLIQKQLAQMEEELFKKHNGTMDKTIEMAATVKGIGRKTATCLLFFTNHLMDFESAAQLAKYIGIAPAVHQSGKTKGRGKITKQGNPLIRSLLYNCAKSARRYNPACKELYDRLRAKGKPHKACMVAVAHKLIRQVFAVVKKNQIYDPAFA